MDDDYMIFEPANKLHANLVKNKDSKIVSK